jgi:hypothetical protein
MLANQNDIADAISTAHGKTGPSDASISFSSCTVVGAPLSACKCLRRNVCALICPGDDPPAFVTLIRIAQSMSIL